MKSLDQIQAEHKIWQDYNFGEDFDISTVLFINMVKEIDKLTYFHSTSNDRIEIKRTIGNSLMFLLSYCNTNGYDIHGIVNDTWETIKKVNLRKKDGNTTDNDSTQVEDGKWVKQQISYT